MKKIFIFSLVFHLFCIGCDDSETEEVAVISEDIVYLSAEQVVLTGRVVANGVLNISSHGFLISTNENLSSPETVELGERDIPGRFVAELSNLIPDSKYWSAAFIKNGEEMLVSETKVFSTLRPELQDFSPRIGTVGEIIIISGANFTNNTKVFFGSTEAEILDIKAESIIRVRIPSIIESQFVTISILSQGIEDSFVEQFEFVTGKWVLHNTFPPTDNSFSHNFAMENEEFAAFGLGDLLFSMQLNNQVYIYDKMMDSWEELAFTGLNLVEPFSSWPYFGSGATNRNPQSGVATSFYKIDNGEILFEGLVPEGLRSSLAFTLGEYLYLFGGVEANGRKSTDIYKYDTGNKVWSVLEGRFFLADAVYIHFTYNNNAFYLGEEDILMKFDPETEIWENVATYPGQVGVEGFAQRIDDKVYIGAFNSRKEIWELDLSDYSWKRKNSFQGDFRANNTITWTVNEEMFVMRHNLFKGGEPMEIWKFRPNEF